ncbi:MAG TPA: hypothetical protein P5248_02675 [Bacteroidales bacterium]|nr:hypothetical protein [Bacteroidales bacterium]
MRPRIILLSLLLLSGVAFIISCSGDDGDRRILARVGEYRLYLDEVLPAIPDGAREADSIFAVRSYVDSWVRQQLVLRQAEKNLRDLEPSVQKQIDEYRNALLIHAFEEALIRENLDTTVTDQEISAYYDEHREDFILKENILKVLYVKLYRGEPSIPTFRRLIAASTPADRVKLAALARQNAVNYYLDDEVWLYFNDLLKEIPINTYNQEAYLGSNRVVDFADSTFQYLVNIREFRMVDNVSPLAMEKERIRFAILNARKTALLDRMSKDLYERGRKRKAFQTYY